MAKFKVPEGCSSLFLGGESIEIIDGVIETDKEIEFLLNNGFTQIVEDGTVNGGEELPTIEELRAKADELGIEYASNLGAKKLAAKIQAFIDANPNTANGGEA